MKAALIGWASLGLAAMMAYCLLIVGIFAVVSKMFEYSLWVVFAKEIPWYGDVVGALVLNGLNFPIFAGCFIAQLCGVEVPLWQV